MVYRPELFCMFASGTFKVYFEFYTDLKAFYCVASKTGLWTSLMS